MKYTIRLSSIGVIFFLLFAKPAVFAGELNGIVKALDGKPLANATVAVMLAANEFLSDQQHITRTDAQGHFHFAGLASGIYGATATFPHLGSASLGKLSVPTNGALSAQTLQLGSEATTFEGDLQTPMGAFSEQAIIVAKRLSDEDGDVFYFYGETQGQHYLLSLAPGRYSMLGMAPGWKSTPQSIAVPSQTTRFNFMFFREHGTEPAIEAELDEMVVADQEVRSRQIKSMSDLALEKEMEKVDAKNQARLKEIIQSNGWPSVALVGKNGTYDAWLLIQHATPAFLKECLPYLKSAAEKGELSWSDVVLSIDRDLMYDGKKQIYGSQFRPKKSGEPELYPVEDEAHLDERRAQVGLEPFAQYKATVLEMYKPVPAAK